MKGWSAVFAAVAAGLAVGLAQPPFSILPGLLGYAVLLWLLDTASEVRPLRSAFLRGWATGAAYFLISTYWVGEAFLVDVQAHGWQAPFAVAFLAGGLGLLWGAAGAGYRWLTRSARVRGTGGAMGPLRILTFAAVFSLFEWVRGHALSGFPWDLPGETWHAGWTVSQGAALVGSYGMSFFTLAIAAAPGVWGGTETRRVKLTLTGAAIGGIVLLFAGGAIRLARAPLPDAVTSAAPSALRVRIVQADIAQADKWSPEAFRTIFETYVRLTAAPGKGRTPQVVIWPESAIPANSADYLADGTWTKTALLSALKPGQILLFGAVRTEGDGAATRYFNTFLALRRDAAGLTLLGHYDKHHLVPFGEYMPADALMGAIGFKALVNVGDGFTEGPKPEPLVLPGLPALQPLICYESLFPAYVGNDRPRPAWIANVSNDAWFGRSSGPWQHLSLASYRAIEEGVPMVRATPTGVSAVIDAYGRALAELEPGVQGVIDADLPQAAPETPYRRLGDGPFWLFVLIGVALPFLGRKQGGLAGQSYPNHQPSDS